jgi:hypothetical protein
MDFSLNVRERSALEALVSGSKDVRQLKRAQALLAVAGADVEPGKRQFDCDLHGGAGTTKQLVPV